jgi:outer membrane protein TolC
MKLVNIHKRYLIIVFIITGFHSIQAQVWTLQQCIDTAQVQNRNLKIGRNNKSIGELKVKETKANLIPKITANADYRYYFNLPYQLMPLSAFGGPAGEYKAIQFGVPNVINANVQLTMPLYNPQVYGAIQTIKIASDLTELQYKKTEEQIYFEISNLYYNAQILHHQIAFINSNINNAERLLKNMQLLNEQLLAKGTDVSKVKLQVAQLAAQKENIMSKEVQVLYALKLALGIPIESNLQIEKKIQFQITKEYTTSSTLDHRIIKTQNQILTSELNTLNKSKFLPSLNLIGTYGYSGFGYNGLPNSFLDFYLVGFAGVQFSYPLFNGTVTQQKINQKRLEIQNSQLQLALNIDQNEVQINMAKMQIGVAKKFVESTTEQVELAKTIYESTTLQQKQGNASLNDILLADNALRESQQNYLAAIIDYLKADLELKKLTGNISTTK